MKTFPKLVIVVMMLDIFISGMLGLGALYGFSIYPFTPFNLGESNTSMHQIQFQASIPMWMPSIQDLKTPITFLPVENLNHWPLTLLVSAILLLVQSFFRGMYLGGIAAVLRGHDNVSLFSCGKHFFRRMLAWSGLQVAAFGFMLWVGILFAPLAVALLILLFLFSLAPYLIVLLDCNVGRAIACSPRLLIRYFWRFVGLALASMLITFVISFLNGLDRPYPYYFVMLVYSMFGTGLIAEFMRQLRNHLQKDDFTLGGVPVHLRQARFARWDFMMAGVLALFLPLAGIWLAEGSHLSAFLKHGEERVEGISYTSGFSDAYSVSGQKFSTYTWGEKPYWIDITLPNLKSGDQPEEIRGLARIQWEVNKEISFKQGNYSSSWIEPAERIDSIYFRMLRMHSPDGSVYYSTLGGSASVIRSDSGSDDGFEDRISVEMMVSGDGKNIFVLQHPTRHDSLYAIQVSDNGRYLIPRTNYVNPHDFRYYWFSNELHPEDIFQMLQTKNMKNSFDQSSNIELLLAAALQEADGEMVVRLLDHLRHNQVKLTAPDWGSEQWTDYLKGRYTELDLMETLDVLSRAGRQAAYDRRLQPVTELDSREQDLITIPFPDGSMAIRAIREDHELRELKIELSLLGGDF
jgi:hypothetical protein